MAEAALPEKYTRLQQISDLVQVPATVFLAPDEVDAVMADHVEVNRLIDVQLGDIALTAGATLERQLSRIDDIARGVAVSEPGLAALTRALDDRLPDWRVTPLAVRSASGDEDGQATSGAGLYESVLDVTGAEELGQAILTVWRSFFRRAPIMSRMGSGRLASGQRIGIMIQPMVPAQAAGVAFSRGPTGGGPTCEYVAGLADALLSGAMTGTRLVAGEAPGADDPLGAEGAQAVFDTVARLKAHFGMDVDVEWVWDGTTLTVVQVRPVTALGAALSLPDAAPHARILMLYEASDADFAAETGLPGYVQYFRAKRTPLNRIARDAGLWRPPAYLLRTNRAGLTLPEVAGVFDELGLCERVVIDAGDMLRQMIVPATEVASTLRAMALPETELSDIVLRAFVAGAYGYITNRMDDGRLAVEYTPDGLMALNRGTARSTLAIVGPDGLGRPAWLEAQHIEQIRRASDAADAQFGLSNLEWSQHDGRPVLIDHSPAPTEAQARKIGGVVPGTISTGFVCAAALRVTDSTQLEDISEGPSISLNNIPSAHEMGQAATELMQQIAACPEPPILVCRRPYALLAVFIPHVAGFVFEEGALLAHLSILIRESGKPALGSRALYDSVRTGEVITLDLPAQNDAVDLEAAP